MNFKNWISVNEMRFKGLERQFRQSHPDVPTYVQNQVYSQLVAPQMKTRMRQNGSGDAAATIAGTGSIATPQESPSQMIDSPYLRNITWHPKPIIINVGPSDFDDETQSRFNVWRFGFRPRDDVQRNDTQRFAVQRDRMKKSPDGENEPIVMVREGGKYKLIDGFHRVMVYLAAKSAPLDQQALLQQGLGGIDLNRWQKIPIQAFVGYKNNYQQPTNIAA